MSARTASAIVSLVIGLGSPNAFSQFSDGTTLVPSQDAGVKDGNLKFHGAVGSETVQYPTKIENRPELSQNNRIEADLEIEYRTLRALSRANVQASKSINLNEQYFAIQELYSGTPNKNGFSFGRRLEYWNQADQDWNLGLWQPLYQGDSLRPLQQGLMGLFYVHEGSDVQFVGYVSPMFIPTMSSDIREQNGTLTSDSRWVRPFPSSVNINNTPTALTYKLDVPSASSLVLQPAIGARLRVGPKDKGAWGSLSYANKPINSLSIKYDAALVSNGGNVSGSATVTPVVHRHHLLSGDLGYDNGPTKYGFSVLIDAPVSQSVQNGTNSSGFQTDYFQQQLKPIQLMSAKAASTTKVFEQDINWTAMYLIAKNDPTIDVDANGVERSQMIPYRLLFTNAISLQGETAWNERVLGKVRYLRDFDQRGSMWNVEFEYKPVKQWAFHLGFDVLGVDDQKAQENDTRFLNYYRQNDRVYGGFAYVF